MLTDAQWVILEPSIEAVRPAAKVPSQHLRRTVSAIVWRHDNGAKWRAVLNKLGPWWMAAQTFIRRSRLKVWERLLTLVQEQGVQLGMTFLDGTSIPAANASRFGERTRKRPGRPKGCTSAQRDHREARRFRFAKRRLGRSRGGYGTKACVITDAIGRAVAFVLAPGQAHELPHAVALLEQLPGVPGWVIADRGYSSHGFREHIWNLGARPAIPPKRNEAPVACPDWIYKHRNQVERLWARLKEWRAVATRYEKTANSFMGVLCMAASMDWLKC